MASTPSAPDFGPPSPPDASRSVRLVKDVLKVGRWKTGYDDAGKAEFWDVTPAVLANIAKGFHAMKAAGVGSNLGKTHGDENLLIHPDDLIAPIEDVLVAGDTLWIASYVTPEQAKYLENPAMKVSVGVVPNWQDGRGKTYAMALVHVAVTDRPVVAGQGPFLALADKAGGSAMDFAAVVEIVNTLIEALGMGKLPEDISEETFVPVMQGIVAAMGKTPEPTPEATPTPEGGDMGAELAMPGVPAPMADTLRKLFKSQDDKITALSDELATRRKAEATAAKNAFHAEVGKLMAGGVTKAVLDSKIKLADKLGSYDLALLDGLAPQLNTGHGAARRLANPNPPTGASDPEADRKEIAARVAKARGITPEAALALVP